MKEKPMISANEINRFKYCPHQWYYKRTYGQKYLQEQYKATKQTHSQHTSYYVKGTAFHSQYYRRYKVMRWVSVACIVLGLLAWMGWLTR